ncbi:MAG: hypothetical protein ACJAS1_005590 [Oleiphilaceae bacterium]|jgi:hypothetical protein
MNIDKAKCLIVAALLLIFFWAGHETNSQQTNLWTLIKDLISTLCSIATIFIANVALNNWKTQAKNSKIDQVVESLSSLEKAQKACSHSVLSMYMYYGEGCEEWKEHADSYRRRDIDLINEIIDHRAKLKQLKRYLDENNYQKLIRLFSDYETNITVTDEFLKYTYPKAFIRLRENSIITNISRFSAQSLKNQSELLYKKYTDHVYSIT